MDAFDKSMVSIVAGIFVLIALWTLAAWHTEVQKTEKLAQAIEAGVDPVKARCAFFGVNSRDDAMCAVVASNQGDKHE